MHGPTSDAEARDMSLQDPSIIKAEHAYRSAQIRKQFVDAHLARELRKQRRQRRHALGITRWYLG